MRGGKPAVRRSELRALFGFGGWVALFGLAALGIESGDRFVVGAVLGAAATAIYVIPIQFAGRLRVVPAALSSALFPHLSTPGALPEDAHRALSSLVHVMTPMVILASLLLAPFFTFWLGGGTAVSAAPIGFVVLLGMWASSLGSVPVVWLQASGRPRVVALLAMAELPVFLAALWLVSGRYGLVGAGVVWAVRAFADITLLLHFAGMLRRARHILLVPTILVVISTLCAFSMRLGTAFLPLGAVVGGSVFVASLWIGREFWSDQLARLSRRSVSRLNVTKP
jgi:O-antigen/teichoic acid export membrane protein